jgi:hypothetical protein
MATDPQFATTIKYGRAAIATANTTRDGSSTTGMVTAITGGSNGTRVSRIRIVATGTTTAGAVRAWLADNAGSPDIRLIEEVIVPAITPSTSVRVFTIDLIFAGDNALIIPANYTLRFTTHNAEAFVCHVWGADF